MAVGRPFGLYGLAVSISIKVRSEIRVLIPARHLAVGQVMNVGFHPIQLVEIMFESSDSEAEHEDTVVTSTYK